MEIYNAVIGEPERVKDDYYYRSRKAVLMHEMYERFGQLIRVRRQRRGEERFETQQGSSEQRSLVRECLRLFTPWDTQCPVPRDFDPLKSVIGSLVSKSGADEKEVEVNRIHAILHPSCFERLVAAFRYSPPAERMELPRFFSEHTNDQSPPRDAPSDLSAEELAEINDMLAEQAGRRRRSSTDAVLRIMVDGVERGRLNPAEESSISFSAEEDAELIEVKTMDADGELLLATYLLTSAKDVVASIRLEGGQYLSLSIARKASDANGGAGFAIKFGYQETSARRAARLWWQRLNLRLVPERAILVGSVLVVICLTGYFAYVRLKSRETIGPAQASIAQATPLPSVADIASPKAPEPTPARRPRVERSIAPKVHDEEVDVTRSGVVVPNLKLSEVKKIYVEIRGDSEIRTRVVETLGSSGVVTATNANEADAALKIVVSQNGEMQARLVNARGTILWRGTSKQIVKDLLSAITRARTMGTHH